MEEEFFIQKAEKIIEDLRKIFEKNKYIYDNVPFERTIKIEIGKEKCEYEGCPLYHVVINMTLDHILEKDFLNMFRYIKRNNLSMIYKNNIFCMVLN